MDRQDLGDIERVFEDKTSGKDTHRVELQEMMSYVHSGDDVIVYSIDKTARDLRHLQSIVTQLNDKGVSIQFLSEPPDV